MTTPTQQETLKLLSEILTLSPQIRIGQLIAWMGELGSVEYQRSLWDLEDEELCCLLQSHRDQIQKRLSQPLMSHVS